MYTNTATSTQSLCKAALRIAKEGKPVFPCKKSDKSPLTANGFYNATTDPGRVHGLFSSHSDALIGVPAGSCTGFFAVDVDRLEALNELPGELPETFTVQSRSGGRHYYYRYVEGISNTDWMMPDGIHIRGEGGYVIVPPSEGYEVINRAPTADAPQWLIDKLLKEERPRVDNVTSGNGGTSTGPIDLDSTEPIPKGYRNNTLTSLGGWLRARGFEQPEIEQALLNINEKRCDPPLDVSEVRRTAFSVSRYEKGKATPPPDKATLEALDEYERALWASPWPKIAGKTERSISVMLIKLARRFGRLTDDGNIAVSVGHRPLALVCVTSRMSIVRAINRSSWFKQEQKGDGTKAGTIALIVPRAKCYHSDHLGGVRRELEKEEASGNTLRAPFSAPRLRWSAPDILRLGKTCEAVVDCLEAYGGSVTVEELAEAMHVSRVRDFRRRNIGRLEERGIVTVEGDTVSLVENWLEALEVERGATGEIAKFRRDQAKFDRERTAWAKRFENEPELAPSNKDLEAEREEWCDRNAASGEIIELERVPEPLELAELYKLMHAKTPVSTAHGRGELWQVFGDRVGVVLDADPDTVTFMHPVEVAGTA